MKKIRVTSALLAASLSLSCLAAGPTGKQQDRPVTAAERAAMIDELVRQLNAYYVSPDTARRLERVVRERQADGSFDQSGSGRALAQALSQLLAAEAGDRHLRVFHSAEKLPARLHDPFDSAPTEDKAREYAQYFHAANYGIAKVERMAGNIGYIKVDFFAPAQYQGVSAAVAAAMTLVNGTGALIIDLRENMGGEPETVAHYESYFFDRATHMNTVYYRDGGLDQQYWATPSVAGPRYGSARPVYLLTSRRTFSGGEDMAYSMQARKRATVVGESTGGGANPGEERRLGDHFTAFIPSGRATNPLTGTNWEGAGVTPDVAVKAGDALATARRLALQEMAAKETDPDARARIGRLLEREQASQP